MPKVNCAVCRKEGDSQDSYYLNAMYFCSACQLWVCWECSGGSVGMFGGSDPECPNCKKKLKK